MYLCAADEYEEKTAFPGPFGKRLPHRISGASKSSLLIGGGLRTSTNCHSVAESEDMDNMLYHQSSLSFVSSVFSGPLFKSMISVDPHNMAASPVPDDGGGGGGGGNADDNYNTPAVTIGGVTSQGSRNPSQLNLSRMSSKHSAIGASLGLGLGLGTQGR